MNNIESHDIISLLDLMLGYTKDKAFEDALKKVQIAQRKYLIADADDRRSKASAVIQSIMELDMSEQMLQLEYERVRPMLTPELQSRFADLFDSLSKQRSILVRKKHSIS